MPASPTSPVAPDAADVLVVGGGIVGMACAEEIARRGRKVVLFDSRGPGGEASWAAGGMLAADYEFGEPGPLAALALASRAMWGGFAARLQEGVPFPLAPGDTGTLVPASSEVELSALHRRFAPRISAGRKIEWLSAAEALAEEPALGPRVAGAAWLREDGWVGNRGILFALMTALRRQSVTIVKGEPASIWLEEGALRGVICGGTRYAAPTVINAAGAWASRVSSGPDAAPGFPEVRPVRGQMLGFTGAKPGLLRHVVRWETDGRSEYAIPRSGGRIVVGATAEPEAGFDKNVTPWALDRMALGFHRALPGLAGILRTHAWAGLRPSTADGMPVIGPHPALPGYLLAVGHFRNGILLAPATARAIAEIACGEEATVPVQDFSPRMGGAAESSPSIQVNGTSRSIGNGMTVGLLLDELRQRRAGVAVAVNEEVVRRGDWDTTPLRDRDRVELIQAVGGG